MVRPVPPAQADRRRRICHRRRRAAARRAGDELAAGARDPILRPHRQGHPHLAARRAARGPRAGRRARPRVRPPARDGQRRGAGRSAPRGRALEVLPPRRAAGLPARRDSGSARGSASRAEGARGAASARDAPLALEPSPPARGRGDPRRRGAASLPRRLEDRHRDLRPLHARQRDRRIPPAARPRRGRRVVAAPAAVGALQRAEGGRGRTRRNPRGSPRPRSHDPGGLDRLRRVLCRVRVRIAPLAALDPLRLLLALLRPDRRRGARARRRPRPGRAARPRIRSVPRQRRLRRASGLGALRRPVEGVRAGRGIPHRRVARGPRIGGAARLLDARRSGHAGDARA